jgi:hypothetical protein
LPVCDLQSSRFAPAFRWRQLHRPHHQLRAEIDDAIGAFNHFKIVLDHNERMPAIYKTVEQLQQ